MESIVAIGILSAVGILINQKTKTKREHFTPITNAPAPTIFESAANQRSVDLTSKFGPYSDATYTNQNVDLTYNRLDTINGPLPEKPRKETENAPITAKDGFNRYANMVTVMKRERSHAEDMSFTKNEVTPPGSGEIVIPGFGGSDDGRNIGLFSIGDLETLGLPHEYVMRDEPGAMEYKQLPTLHTGTITALVNQVASRNIAIDQVRTDNENTWIAMPNSASGVYKTVRPNWQQKDAFCRVQMQRSL